MQQTKLPRFYHSQSRKEFCFAFAEFFVRYFVQLETHLQLEQLLLDHGVVVQLLIGHLLNLAEDELKTVDRRQQ